MARVRALYGASPAHLLAHLAALPLAAFALLQIAELSTAGRIFLWLAGSVVLHDFLLLPLYGALDRVGHRVTGPAAINFVRVPALLSGLLLLVYLPVIADKGGNVFRNVSGLEYEGYLARWLLVTAALFAASGALYLLRSRGGGSST